MSNKSENIVELVARAISFQEEKDSGFKNPTDENWPACRKQAVAAIEAMRDLVKCDPNGNKYDNDVFNIYITNALKVSNVE